MCKPFHNYNVYVYAYVYVLIVYSAILYMYRMQKGLPLQQNIVSHSRVLSDPDQEGKFRLAKGKKEIVFCFCLIFKILGDKGEMRTRWFFSLKKFFDEWRMKLIGWHRIILEVSDDFDKTFDRIRKKERKKKVDYIICNT